MRYRLTRRLSAGCYPHLDRIYTDELHTWQIKMIACKWHA